MQKQTLCRLSKDSAKDILQQERACLPVFVFILMLALSLTGGAFLLWQIAIFFVKIGTINIKNAGFLAAALFCLTLSFLFAPIWEGMKSLFFQRLSLGRMDYKTFFLYFNHPKRYFYAVRRALFHLLQLVLTLGSFSAIAFLGTSVARNLVSIDREVAACIVLCVTVLLLVFLVFFYVFLRTNAFLMSAAFLCAPLLKDRQLRTVSHHKMKSGRHSLFRLDLSFFLIFLLSSLLLFLPLLFVIPYYVVSRVCLSYHLLLN